MILQPDLDARIRRIQMWAGIIAVVALVLAAIGAFAEPDVFFRSWLMAWLLWLGVTLGSMAIVMLQFLTGGQWGVVSRRIFEAAARTIPLLAILFVPILFGLHQLYPWTHADLVAGDPVLRHKQPYLNIPFFVIRVVIYFAIWIGWTFMLQRAADRQDDPASRWRARALSASGLVVYVFSMTLAATDWAQSLQPHWYSTIWGFLFVAGQGLSAMALAICTMLVLMRWEPLAGVVRARHIHDLGKLLLMFVLLWAYLSFSQLLIIWSGNLPEEAPWYIQRLATNWVGVGVALLLFQFLFPFLLLLSRPLKRHMIPLFAVAALVFVMRQVDVYWMVVPDVHGRGLEFHWLHIVCPIATGAAWVTFWMWQLRQRALLPENDPDLAKVTAHA